jgi:hypothetical protein
LWHSASVCLCLPVKRCSSSFAINSIDRSYN